MTLYDAGEFGIIRRIQKKFPGAAVPLGIGDDAAAILSSPLNYTLLTTDTLVEGTHFDLSYSRFSALGYKALAVNLSDIAAMGGRPRYSLISLGLKDSFRTADIDQLYRGLQKASQEAGVALIGGNTTRSDQQAFIGITLIGEISRKELVTRAGAKVGDALFVTGSLGDAAAGLSILKKGWQSQRPAQLIRRYDCPRARFREGRLLGKEKIPSAMIDISDGLTADLNHIMEMSRVGAELLLEQIPISLPLRSYAKKQKLDPLEFALFGGEDYELLFSVPQKRLTQLEKLLRSTAIQATHIGSIIEKRHGLVVKKDDGSLRKIDPGGYDHFRKAWRS